MKTIVRNNLRKLKRTTFLMTRGLGLSVPKPTDISFVVEKQDWAIKWVGENISETVNECSSVNMSTTIHPEQLDGQVVHFGSQYMWVDWHSITSKNNKCIVSFFHGKPSDGPEAEKHVESFLKTIPSLDRIVTAASLIENRLLEWGVPREKLVKIPIGVDTKKFTPCTTEEKNLARKKLGVNAKTILIGSFQKDGIGWGEGLEPKLIKGPDIFVETMRKLKAAGLPVVALLTGPARGYVKLMLEKYNIPFVHNYVQNHSDLVDYYRCLDFYCVSSREEGGPKGIIESMACGVPVVSTEVGMAPDFIHNNKTGFMVKTEDYPSLADSIINLYQNPELRKQVIENSLQKVKEADWAVVGRDHWEKVYKPLILNEN